MSDRCHEKKKMQNALTECSALVLIIVFIWSIICIAKGIWPFGYMLLDIGDMGEQCVPAYTHIWDVLHGKKNLFFDWHTGLGNNMAGVVLHFGLISPFNIFFLFIKRSAIEASMSIYIMIKLVAAGFAMRFLLRKWFPGISGWMRLSFSLLYVFSSFNMQYYYAPMWLDVSFMFPLVIYGYFRLMNEKKKLLYMVCLAITCMMSFQHTYMLFLMLLFLTGILPLLSREKYQKVLPGLLAATLIAMLLASWIWIPGAIQILSASRAGNNHSLVEIWNSVWIFFTAKWMKLLNMGIPLAFFLAYAGKHFKEKGVKFFGFVILIICAPIVLESTNLLWHGGSYQGYTMRFSYMVAFWILTAGAYAYQHRDLMEGSSRISAIAGGIGILLLLGVSAGQYLLLKSDETVYKSSISAVSIILIVCIGAAGGAGVWYLKKSAREKVVFAAVIVQSLILAMTSVLISGEKERSSFAVFGEAVKDVETKEDFSPIHRIKSMDVQLSHNYPLIMRKNAISNYTGVNSKKQIDGVVNLGYAQVGFRMSDYGGTLFSDALLGVTQVIGRDNINDSLYEYEMDYGAYGIYRSRYGYGQGIKMEEGLEDNDMERDSPFSWQNHLAKKVLGTEIFDIITAENNKMAIEVGRESILYLYANREESFEEITVTNRDTGENYRLVMPESGWLNGILELGTWEKSTVEIEIKADEAVGKVTCALLPLQKFAENVPDYFESCEINSGDTDLTIYLDGAEEKDSLFLPVYHDKGWTCTVNGKKTTISEFADAFMVIPLQSGENEINLSFMPPGFKAGALMTFLGLLGLTAVVKYPIRFESKRAGRVLWVLDEIVFGSLITVFYVIPVVFLVAQVGKLWIKI